jgi:fructokinase
VSYPRVICLGEILSDRISNQPGLPLDQVTAWTDYPGGAPANVACALAKLGTSVGFVGAVGIDQLGQSLVQVLTTIGVDVRGIQHHPTAPTRTVLVVRSATGDRSFAAFSDKHDTTEFADTRLQAQPLPVELFVNADYLVLGTLELAYTESRAAIARALELADQAYLKVVLDVNWRPVFWRNPTLAPALIHPLIERADFLKLAKEEAEWLFRTADPAVISHRVGSLEGVIVTDGDRGCTYCFGDYAGHVPAFKVEVEDTTGAGDSFVAGFVHQLCQQGLSSLNQPQQVEQIMTYASAVGALTTVRAGAIAAQPTAAEVEAFFYLKARMAEEGSAEQPNA